MSGYNRDFSRKTAAAAAAVCIGIPIVNVIYDFIPYPVLGALLLLSAAALIIYGYDKKRKAEMMRAVPQTCSDIRSINFSLGAGNFVIRSGDRFSLEAVNVKSYISDGVWHIESGIHADNNINAVSIINLPEDFTAQKAEIHLRNGNILVEKFTAYNSFFDIRSGSGEIKSLYSKNLRIHCGSGTVDADAALHGNADISCNAGNVALSLKNSAEDFRIKAVTNGGIINANGKTLSGHSHMDLNETAPFEVNIRCDSGKTAVSFI